MKITESLIQVIWLKSYHILKKSFNTELFAWNSHVGYTFVFQQVKQNRMFQESLEIMTVSIKTSISRNSKPTKPTFQCITFQNDKMIK